MHSSRPGRQQIDCGLHRHLLQWDGEGIFGQMTDDEVGHLARAPIGYQIGSRFLKEPDSSGLVLWNRVGPQCQAHSRELGEITVLFGCREPAISVALPGCEKAPCLRHMHPGKQTSVVRPVGLPAGQGSSDPAMDGMHACDGGCRIGAVTIV
jgi:hypothetical protein